MPHDTRMAISPQRVIRYTSCLVLGYGFQGRRIELGYFGLYQIQAWKNLNSRISAKDHAIHFMLRFYGRVFRAPILNSMRRAVIFAIAQLSSDAREVSESCVSQNSRSLETEQLCVLAQGGYSGVSPREIFCNLWVNLHSKPFRGQNDFKKYMQSRTYVWAKFSLFLAD